MNKGEIDPKEIIKFFSIIADPRVERTKEHRLIDIIVIALCSVLCGAEGFTEIEEFGKSKKEWFKSFLELPNGIPSHDTFRRVFMILDAKNFREVLIRWTREVTKRKKGEIVSIDGKTARGSQKNGKAVLHSVSAWAHDAGVVLGEVKTAEKSNEITAIPELLKSIDVKGSIVTIDAMGCQKKIVKKIRKSEADYVLGLKGNHGDLHNDVELYLTDARKNKFRGIKHAYHKTIDEKHGRKEHREYWVTEEIDWLYGGEQWQNLRSIGMVFCRREANKKVSEEVRYYISSMAADAEEFSRAVRGHWGIENSLHWVLDVCFREDECRVRSGNAPENLAILRRLSLNILKHTKHHSRGIKVKMKRAGWDNLFLEKLLCEI